MQIALPSDYLLLQSPSESVAQRLLALAKIIKPKPVAKCVRAPKIAKPKEWLEGKAAHAHVSTDRVLKAHKKKTP
ncbi:isrso13-transposase domain protein [Pseudomonas fluorescens]|uniref:Isrso13-transposase domain protein n=1 Tax=Pseudomonas fluorescens TaxID=294 RepID=A0A0P8Z875_PSEFL|nr:isrso13-transposase domain protein [Pseudomonas fluorescens]